ncbi:recombinase family protein [Ornithinimicrobium humiphilum]|uniref:DNA invertase Pin-like site-specific DNA recombinase n=1 Tax=Ornithinimicrobium humiphilum TaxID=125288 RepID=A0A543KKE6_9MICO|nr:recombinase family protein [Ornithinimicrobium humiphilum]TQM95526.1 DNA invertase Pin-like site-specific DNA recombinase [Ornithinimicrobium humiphilum]
MTEQGQVVAYVRVSSWDQRTDRQDVGRVDRVFEDHASAGTTDRPAYRDMMSYLRDGDTLRVWSMDRLARSLVDLVTTVQSLVDRGVVVEFLREQLVFRPGADDPYANFQLQLLGSVAELERALIRQRQREGVAKARARGAYRGRAPKLSPDQVAEIRAQVAAGVPKAAVARRFSVGRATLYRALAN